MSFKVGSVIIGSDEDNGVEDIIVDGQSGGCESEEEICGDDVPGIGFEKKN